MAAKSAAGETLSAPKVDSVNTFEALSTVAPRPVWAKVQAGNLSLKLDPKSVTVIGLAPTPIFIPINPLLSLYTPRPSTVPVF